MDFEQISRELIRSLRAHRSQLAFSRWLGYDSNVLYAWESGRRWPTGAEMLRAAARAGVNVRDGFVRFYGAEPPWLGDVDPATPEGVARLLRDLRGETPIGALARRSGQSRFSVSRWLSGQTQPRLPHFLRIVEAASLRLLDFLEVLADPASIPSAATAFEQLEAHRRMAYELPWTQAVLRALELSAYQKLPAHQPGWISARLGISQQLEDECISILERAGQIRLVQNRYTPSEVLALDTRRDPGLGQRLKQWSTEVGLDRLTKGAPGQFSYNVFTVSSADLERIRALHLAYFRHLRAIVAESEPGEHVVIANVQLFPLD